MGEENVEIYRESIEDPILYVSQHSKAEEPGSLHGKPDCNHPQRRNSTASLCTPSLCQLMLIHPALLSLRKWLPFACNCQILDRHM